jgi:hypothetical protein
MRRSWLDMALNRPPKAVVRRAGLDIRPCLGLQYLKYESRSHLELFVGGAVNQDHGCRPHTKYEVTNVLTYK